MGVRNYGVADDAKLTPDFQSPWQAVLKTRILLLLIQIATEDRVRLRDAVIDASLHVVGLVEGPPPLLAIILVAEDIGIAEVGFRPEGQVLFRNLADAAGGDGVVGERCPVGEGIANYRPGLTREIAALPGSERHG